MTTATTKQVTITVSADHAELIRDLLHKAAVEAKQANRGNRVAWIDEAHNATIKALHPERFN
jgi:hypothetical protein